MTQKAPMMKPLTADEIRAQHELNGARHANTKLIMYALDQLKPGDERTNVEKLAALTLEREEIVVALRIFAANCGVAREWREDRSLVELIDEIAKAVADREGVPKATPEKSKR